MDGKRFDDLTRLFGHGTTRRSVVAAALGLAALAADGDAASARRPVCRASGVGCSRGAQCCTGYCNTSRHAPRHLRNRCACPEGESSCFGACVDTTTDNDHCGGCGSFCQTGQVCLSSLCVCAPPTTICDSSCVDTDTDVNNCGDCGSVCDTVNGEECHEGGCCGALLAACSIDTDCCDPVLRLCDQGQCRIKNGGACENNTGSRRLADECEFGGCYANGTCGV